MEVKARPSDFQMPGIAVAGTIMYTPAKRDYKMSAPGNGSGASSTDLSMTSLALSFPDEPAARDAALVKSDPSQIISAHVILLPGAEK